ncbi:hypothetical protein SLA2020_414630 [Shorea laevis]
MAKAPVNLDRSRKDSMDKLLDLGVELDDDCYGFNNIAYNPRDDMYDVGNIMYDPLGDQLSTYGTSTFKHHQLGLMDRTISFKRLPSMDLVKMKVIFLFSLGF